MPSGDWYGRAVTVTGGASFIGSHLVDALVRKGSRVRVVDNLTSGRLDNVRSNVESGAVEFVNSDLRDLGDALQVLEGSEFIFHLAADHGGRGYVDLHPAECATNLVIDGVVFMAAHQLGVAKVVYASSGCVYPNFLQRDVGREIYLSEDQVGPPYDSDNTYGYAKLMGEMTLQAYYREHGLKSASCRYFTVYGPRGVENHAVIAMIARAFLGENPFEVWGNGEQIRNWTYVDDIVDGTILAAERIDDGTAVNLGTTERISVIDAVNEVLRYTGHRAELRFLMDMPTGPLNRVASNHLARELLGWEPKVAFVDGLHRTINWYYSSKNRSDVEAEFARLKTER